MGKRLGVHHCGFQGFLCPSQRSPFWPWLHSGAKEPQGIISEISDALCMFVLTSLGVKRPLKWGNCLALALIATFIVCWPFSD